MFATYFEISNESNMNNLVIQFKDKKKKYLLLVKGKYSLLITG